MLTLLDGDLYQWDTGRVVVVEQESGYEVNEVHFSTSKIDFAYVVKTKTEDGITYCPIPNILLQQVYDIYCYEVRKNKYGEESLSTTVLKITKRNRPVDYVYTDPEKYTYKELEGRIDVMEASIEDLKNGFEEASILANQAYSKAEEVDAAMSTIGDRVTSLEERSITGDIDENGNLIITFGDKIWSNE